jgi:hypothetical protein
MSFSPFSATKIPLSDYFLIALEGPNVGRRVQKFDETY